uniref:Uncharacterized protein n=1 Tax=Tanacetum cinerariifolium TaxID=118510 RepID=A0A6L2MYY9_TANCI|nr:hypothetical protein [Tanacetum cinerariifolium]
MTSEEFTEVHLPHDLAYHGSLSLSKSLESLVVIQQFIKAGKLSCVVWMMNDGDLVSFTKVFNINTPCGSLYGALRFNRNGEPITKKRQVIAKHHQSHLKIMNQAHSHLKFMKSATMTQHKLNKHVPDKSCELVGVLDLWHECSGEKVKGSTSMIECSKRRALAPQRRREGVRRSLGVLWLEEKLDQQEEEHVRREAALKKEFEDQRKEDHLNGKRSLRNSKILCLEDHHIPFPLNDAFTDGSLMDLTVSVATFSNSECGKFVGKERQIFVANQSENVCEKYVGNNYGNPVEEIEEIQVPVTQKKTSRRRQTAPKKKHQKEKGADQRCIPWTLEEETALYKGWVRISEYSIKGNMIKERGFWIEILNGASDVDYLQKALIDYQAEYGVPFTLLQCWEESGEGSINLNTTVRDEAENEVEEVRRPKPMGRDQAKRKVKAGSASSASSFDVEPLTKMMVSDKREKAGIFSGDLINKCSLRSHNPTTPIPPSPDLVIADTAPFFSIYADGSRSTWHNDCLSKCLANRLPSWTYFVWSNNKSSCRNSWSISLDQFQQELCVANHNGW